MNIYYPECDEYVCEVCPRQSSCDVAEQEDLAALSPDYETPLSLRIVTLEDSMASLRTTIDQLQVAVSSIEEEITEVCRTFSSIRKAVAGE